VNHQMPGFFFFVLLTFFFFVLLTLKQCTSACTEGSLSDQFKMPPISADHGE
jgi:hypothetical protein